MGGVCNKDFIHVPGALPVKTSVKPVRKFSAMLRSWIYKRRMYVFQIIYLYTHFGREEMIKVNIFRSLCLQKNLN